jgi:hypothetical protein
MASGRPSSAISLSAGYYSAIVVQEDGQTKIMEETVTIAAP